mgnify:CR=1 FL=1
MKVIVIGHTRQHLLNATVSSVQSGLKPYDLEVWLDKSNDLKKQAVLIDMMRKRHVNTVIFSTHVGMKTLWLTALSLDSLIVEDDVVVSPYASQWLEYAKQMYTRNANICGVSLAVQTTVAQAYGSNTLAKMTTPYLYPLVGSHGFMITPNHKDSFNDFVRTRAERQLNIKGFVTTTWYKQHAVRGQSDRMWSQEFVAYAYHKKCFVLYSPIAFSKHLSRDRGEDSLLNTRAFAFERPRTWSQTLPVLNWTGVCMVNCHLMPRLLQKMVIPPRVRTAMRSVVPIKKSYWARPWKRLESDLTLQEEAFLTSLLTRNTRYFEWGCGKTTKLANDLASSVVSIEGNSQTIRQLKSRYIFKPSTSIKYANLGPVREFSWPITKKNGMVYVDSLKLSDQYDVIVIDGRYRVACALTSFLYMSYHTNVRLLFHDFERSVYREVRRFFTVDRTVGRLVLLRRKYLPISFAKARRNMYLTDAN